MFRFLAICALATLAAAAPGFVSEHHVVQPVVAKVGAVVHSAPSAVSHQSFTQYHSEPQIVKTIEPVVPVVKTVAHTYAAPAQTIVKSYAAAPVVQTYAAPAQTIVKSYAPAPVVQTYAAPAQTIVKSYAPAPVVQTYAAPAQTYLKSYAPAAAYQTYAAPAVVKTYSAAPAVVKTVHTPVTVSHAVSHQSHVQVHQKQAVITPVVKTYAAAPVVHTYAAAAPVVTKSVVHSSPVVYSAPAVQYYHH